MHQKELVVDFDRGYQGTDAEQAQVRNALEAVHNEGCVWVTLSRMPSGWRVVLARMVEKPFHRVGHLIESPGRDEGVGCTGWVRFALENAKIPMETRT